MFCWAAGMVSFTFFEWTGLNPEPLDCLGRAWSVLKPGMSSCSFYGGSGLAIPMLSKSSKRSSTSLWSNSFSSSFSSFFSSKQLKSVVLLETEVTPLKKGCCSAC